MWSSALTRWGGVAALSSGVLFILGDLLGLIIGSDNSGTAVTTPYFIVQHMLYLFGAVLLLGGLVGLYVGQSEAAGALGLAGFLLAFLGTALSLGAFWAQAFIIPMLARLVPAILEIIEADPPWAFEQAVLLFALGWLLFAVATLRAQVYPRVATILLAIGAATTFFPFIPVRTLVFGVGIAWLGFALFSRRDGETEQSHGDTFSR